MELGEPDQSGRRSPVVKPGSEFDIACDVVIMALGTSPNPLLRKATPDLEYSDRGGIVVQDDTVTTMKDGVFAGGDANPHRANVVIEAIADGKRAAVNIDRYLGGRGELNKGAPIDIPTIPDEVVEEHPRFPFHTLAPEKRCDNFDEVVCGYHRLDAMAEPEGKARLRFQTRMAALLREEGAAAPLYTSVTGWTLRDGFTSTKN